MVAARPLPDLAGVYYATVFANAFGHPTNNVFTFQLTPAPPAGTTDLAVANDVGVAVNARWATFATTVMPQSYVMDHIRTYALHSPLSPAIITPSTGSGGNIGATAALMVGALIKHDVFRRGKGSQSRTTITPILEADIDSPGTGLIAPFQASLTTAFNTFITGVLTDLNTAAPGTWNYVQLSKGTPAKGPIVVPAATYRITASAAETKLSTQRRRVQRNS